MGVAEQRELRAWLEVARSYGLSGAQALTESASAAVAEVAPPQAEAPPQASAPPQPAADAPLRGIPGLVRVEQIMGDCRRCGLCEGRRTMVYGEGNPDAELMFIGEGPGAREDATGRPFVGPAGELLTKMIEAGMKRPRGSVFITNVVKCRPPNNRNPEPPEVASCAPFLAAQVEAVNPRMIVLLGGVALKALRPGGPGIMRSRGRFIEVFGRPTMPTFHPSYLLRRPEAKIDAWRDLQAVMERLGWS